MHELVGGDLGMVLVLNREAVAQVLTMADCIEAVEGAFGELAANKAVMPLRPTIGVKGYEGISLYMPAYLMATGALACKIVTVYKNNPQKFGLPTTLGTVLLQDPATGGVVCAMDGGIVTAMRTGAVTGVAAKYLARRDSKTVGLFGAGVQARTQLEAACTVLGIEKCKVYDLNSEASERLARELAPELGIDIASASSALEAMQSDVVLTATTSEKPILDGRSLLDGTFVSGIGSHSPTRRELDTETIRRSKLVVDQRSASLAEAGDVIIPIKEGAITEEHIYAELGELVLGEKPGRTSDDEITVFKSVGLAIQDAATAKLVYEKAREAGVGVEVEL